MPLTITAVHRVSRLPDVPEAARTHRWPLADFTRHKTWDKYIETIATTSKDYPAVIVTFRRAGPLAGAALDDVAKQRGCSKSGRRWRIVTDQTPICPATEIHPGDIRNLRRRLAAALRRDSADTDTTHRLRATTQALVASGRCAGTLSTRQLERHGIDAADAAHAAAWLTEHGITTRTATGYVLAPRVLRGLRALETAGPQHNTSETDGRYMHDSLLEAEARTDRSGRRSTRSTAPLGKGHRQ